MSPPDQAVPAETIFARSTLAGRAPRADRVLPVLLQPLYRLYERRLHAVICAGTLPRHIGIILDGNRRHARKLGITDPRIVYGIGARKLDNVLDWCGEIEIPTVTLRVFSPENLRRPGEEVLDILAAIEAKLTALAQDERIHDRGVRVRPQ